MTFGSLDGSEYSHTPVNIDGKDQSIIYEVVSGSETVYFVATRLMFFKTSEFSNYELHEFRRVSEAFEVSDPFSPAPRKTIKYPEISKGIAKLVEVDNNEPFMEQAIDIIVKASTDKISRNYALTALPDIPELKEKYEVNYIRKMIPAVAYHS